MGILLCEQNFRDVWRRNKSVMGEIGKILRTHKHTHAAKLVVRISSVEYTCTWHIYAIHIKVISARYLLTSRFLTFAINDLST